MRYHLAQLNVAIPRGPLDGSLMADFMALLEPVNAMADKSPGFVWRLQTDRGDATDLRAPGDGRLMVNMSVWESLEALREFVYGNLRHTEAMRRRREWFEQMVESFVVLWWVPAGHIPTLEEAEEHLDHLRRNGPTSYAFTFRHSYEPETNVAIEDDRDLCPA